MREIKFRIWEWQSKMNYNVEEDWGSVFYRLLDGNHSNSGIVMQYTGLKDKQGVEIYEGDIVQLTFSRIGGISEITKVVEWGGVGYEPFVGSMVDADDISRRYEVIGNIYENPELKEKLDD